MGSHLALTSLATLLLVAPAVGLAQQGAAAPSTAAPACDGQAMAQLKAVVDQGRQAVYDEDGATVARLHDSLAAQVPCLAEVVAPELWARHLVDLAIVAYADQGDWQSPLAAALATWPTVDRVVGSQHPIARWEPPAASATRSRAVPPGGAIYLDGRWVSYLSELRGPHLVQVERGGELRSWLVQGDGSDSAWAPAVAWLQEGAPADTATTTASDTDLDARSARSGRTWLLAGGVVGVVGAGLGVGTWAARDSALDDPGQQTTLVAGNTVGWGLALVGGGLVGVGLVQSLDADARLLLGPGSLTLQGSFR